MTTKAEFHLPVLNAVTNTDINRMGTLFGSFNPLNHIPKFIQKMTFNGKRINCKLLHDRDMGEHFYWFIVGSTFLFLDFDKAEKFKSKIILDKSNYDGNFLCVRLDNMRSDVKEQGYGTLAARLLDVTLQQISKYNKMPIYACTSDGSKTGWTTAVATALNFKEREQITQPNSVTMEKAKKLLYKWYYP